MFKQIKDRGISRGNFFMFFTNGARFRKYMLCILIGLPTWFVIGILVNLSNKFAAEMNVVGAVESDRAIMIAYVGIAIGDIAIGFLSQWLKSRKKALFIFYGLTIISLFVFFNLHNATPTQVYMTCFALGFSTGFWAIFVTIAAESFGTNLRATAATTVPNMVRGALPLITILFKSFQPQFSFMQAAIYTGIIVIIITLIAAAFIKETFGRDLNYLETEEMMP